MDCVRTFSRQMLVMRKWIFISCIQVCCSPLFAQTIVARDTAIENMVQQVSADSLKSYITKLVSFGTRNTLSTQKDPARGIGAARSWVLSRFNELSKQSKG